LRDDEEEREIISSPHSLPPPPLENLRSPSDIFSQQMGIPASAHWAKRPPLDAGGASSLPPQSDNAPVCSVLSRMHVRVIGARIAYLLGAL
jgi:hypothetical protein